MPYIEIGFRGVRFCGSKGDGQSGYQDETKATESAASTGDPPSWEQRFRELESFKQTHGHCNVSCEDKANPALGRWVASLRHRKKEGTLAKDRILLLDSLGFCWERKPSIAAANAAAWKQRINDLKSFKKKHGHCNVPSDYSPNRSLGIWVRNIRSKKKAGKLAKDRIRRLEGLGFSWVLIKRSVGRLDWDVMLAALTAFKERYGHCNVSANSPENRRLGTWVVSIRRKKRKGKLDHQQIAQLNRLGIVWEMSIKHTSPEMYAALVEYKSVHGDCNVPTVYQPNPALARWVTYTRVRKKQNKLGKEIIRRLTRLGFCWSRHVNWDEHVHDLKVFKKEHGHCNVPMRYPPNKVLGYWVNDIRQQKKRGTLAKERIIILDGLGFLG